jgi:hypothetical protein
LVTCTGAAPAVEVGRATTSAQVNRVTRKVVTVATGTYRIVFVLATALRPLTSVLSEPRAQPTRPVLLATLSAYKAQARSGQEQGHRQI